MKAACKHLHEREITILLHTLYSSLGFDAARHLSGLSVAT